MIEMLPPEVTLAQEKLIVTVAQNAIRGCPCYGHLCDRCSEAKFLLAVCGVSPHLEAAVRAAEQAAIADGKGDEA